MKYINKLVALLLVTTGFTANHAIAQTADAKAHWAFVAKKLAPNCYELQLKVKIDKDF